MKKGIFSKIEDWASKKVTSHKSVGGGCIAKTEKLQFEDGFTCFLKTGTDKPDTFFKEANGLIELKKADCIRIPEALLVDSDFLLIEFIEQGVKDNNFFSCFGTRFANLHKHTADKFGFKEDNYIGATPQKNIPNSVEATNWCDFYYNKRLLFQYKLAEKNRFAGKELKEGFILLEKKIEKILEGSDDKPTLLHGDLWSGNFLCDKDSNPCLIDPAVYYGHREADLAMTKLFGGFTDDFYTAYNETLPLPSGYEYRENIYLLYHVVNHLNLFGSSYYSQAVRLIRSYVD